MKTTKYKKLALMILIVFLLLLKQQILNANQNYYIDQDKLIAQQKEMCPKQLVDSFSTESQKQDYQKITKYIKSFHQQTLQQYIIQNKTVKSYQDAITQQYSLPGIFLLLLGLMILIFQVIVLKQGKNKICKRNLQIDLIKNYELVLNVIWVIILCIILFLVNVMIIRNQTQFNDQSKQIKCGISSFFNEVFNGGSSQTSYRNKQRSERWLGVNKANERVNWMDKHLEQQLNLMKSVPFDFTGFTQKSQVLGQKLDNIYINYKNVKLKSPSRSDSNTNVEVDSKFISESLGPASVKGTSLHSIQTQVDLFQVSGNSRQMINTNSQYLLSGSDIALYNKAVVNTGTQLVQQYNIYSSAIDDWNILLPLVDVLVYGCCGIQIIMTIGVLLFSRRLYNTYHTKYAGRLSLSWIIFLCLAILLAIALVVLLPLMLSLADHCQVWYLLQTKESLYFKYTPWLDPQFTTVSSRCVFGNGIIFDQLPGYTDILLLNQTLFLQKAQLERSDYLNANYLNILNSRVEVENQIILLENIQKQYTLDSTLSTERNHLNALLALSKWTDYSINTYVSCRITKDRFVFQLQDCPQNYVVYKSNTATPAGSNQPTCIQFDQIDLATLRARYVGLRTDPSCVYQLDQLEVNFEVLKTHYSDRFDKFTGLIGEYQQVKQQMLALETLLTNEQQATQSTMSLDQNTFISILHNNQHDFNCTFVQEHLPRITNSFCHSLFPTLFSLVFYFLLANICLLLLANRIFAFINLQKLFYKQNKMYNKVAKNVNNNNNNDQLVNLPNKSQQNSQINLILNSFMDEEDDIDMPNQAFNQAQVNLALDTENQEIDDD